MNMNLGQLQLLHLYFTFLFPPAYLRFLHIGYSMNMNGEYLPRLRDNLHE